MSRKTILKWIGAVVAVLLVAFIEGTWSMFGTMITAAKTIEKLEDGLYSMEYRVA